MEGRRYMDIDVTMKIDRDAMMSKSEKSRTIAKGWVEVENCIKFPVFVRTYIDKETQEEKMFVSMPQRKGVKGYSNIISFENKETREEIEDVVLKTVLKQAFKSFEKVSILETKITLLPEDTKNRQVKIKGIASIKLEGGIRIQSILIKEGKNGLFVEMPQYFSEGSYHDTVYGTSEAMRDELYQTFTGYGKGYCWKRWSFTKNKTIKGGLYGFLWNTLYKKEDSLWSVLCFTGHIPDSRLMLQSIAQLQTLYKENKWETMMDNLATVVYLGSGPAAKSTHEWISNLLSTSTVDSRSDNVHLGANGNSGLDFHRAEIKLMTPEQVKRMPPTECIVFIESRPPVYDRKAIPFDKPDYGFVATDFLKKRYSEALGLGEYEHPVHTVYDPIHFRYITVEQEKRLQVVTKQEDIESFQEAAKNDPRILTCNIDETELLYLNWNRRKCSVEEVQQIFMQTIEAEKRKMEDLKGLSVLQDVDGGEIILPKPVEEKSDKTGWNMDCSLREILSEHWNDLSQMEQEEICIDLASDLNETQIKEILRLPVDEMEVRRRAYILMNKDNKKQATG